MKKQIDGRIDYLHRRANAAPKKIATNRKVGVWTDDYSNLLSVFNDLDSPALKLYAIWTGVLVGLFVAGLLLWHWTNEQKRRNRRAGARG